MAELRDTLGFIDRVIAHGRAEREREFAGKKLGDNPLTRYNLPVQAAASMLNFGGLQLEGIGTVGKAAAGIALAPAVALEASGFADNGEYAADRARSQRLMSNPVDLLRHPGRTVDELRRSENDITSYLAGATEMLTDPTNLIAPGVGKAAQGAKRAKTAARLAAGATVSDEVTSALPLWEGAKEVPSGGTALDRLNFFDELVNTDEITRKAREQGQDSLRPLLDALEQSKEAVRRARSAIDERSAYYKSVQGLKAKAVREMKAELKPKRADIKTDWYQQLIDERKNEVTAGLPADAPRRGQTRAEYLDPQFQAYYKVKAADEQLVKLYKEAKAQLPGPVKYDQEGNAIGPDKGKFLNIGAQQNNSLDEEIRLLNNKVADDASGSGVSTRHDGRISAILEGGPPKSGQDVWQARVRDSDGNEALVPLDKLAQFGFYEIDRNALMKGRRVYNDTVLDIMEPQQKPGFDKLVDKVANAKPLADADPEEAEALGSYMGIMSSFLHTAIKQSWAVQKEAMKAQGGKLDWGAISGSWKGLQTQTIRNAVMDPTFNRIVAANAGISQRAITDAEKTIADRINKGATDELYLFGDLSDWFQLTGRADEWRKQGRDKLMQAFGGSAWELENDSRLQLNAIQSMLVNAGIGMANPVRGSVNALFLPLGYLAPMRQSMFKIINNVTHVASRTEAFKQAYVPYLENSAERLLQAAQAEGRDIGRLADETRSLASAGGPRVGNFSPREVSAQLGQRWGDEWARMVEEAENAGFNRATEVFGNFANRRPEERMVDRFFPFMSWSWRAYPRVARMALEHPAVTAGLIHLYKAERAQAESEGRPSYQYGTLGINNDTPLMGVLLNVFSPEQEAELRFNPLALLNPMSTDLLAAGTGAPDTGSEDDSPFKKVIDTIGLTGASPSPALQTAMYLTGQDWRGPGALSRYAAFDQLPDELGIGYELPSLAHGTLRKGRELLTGEKDTYDPVKAKAYELVYEDTGLPVSDRRNKQLAVAIESGNSPYLDKAERVLDVSGSVRAGFNANSPVSLQLTSETKKAERKAKKDGLPHSYEEIQKWKELLPPFAKQMEAENAEWLRTHPVAAIGKKPSVSNEEKRRFLLQQALMQK